MFVGGLDASGHSESDSHEYLSMVIGDKNAADLAIARLGLGDTVHMRQIRNRHIRDWVMNNLDLSGGQIATFCIKVDRRKVLDRIWRVQSKKSRRRPDAFLLARYNKALFWNMRHIFSACLDSYRCVQSDISFQCDFDSIGFAQDNALKTTKPGSAHSIADIVAYANLHRHPIKNVIEMNLVAETGIRLRKSVRW